MTFDWQNLIVLAIIAGAALFVARRVWAAIFAKRASACGSCRNCNAEKSPAEVFSITSPAASQQSR